jgi:hypothetical protein
MQRRKLKRNRGYINAILSGLYILGTYGITFNIASYIMARNEKENWFRPGRCKRPDREKLHHRSALR